MSLGKLAVVIVAVLGLGGFAYYMYQSNSPEAQMTEVRAEAEAKRQQNLAESKQAATRPRLPAPQRDPYVVYRREFESQGLPKQQALDAALQAALARPGQWKLIPAGFTVEQEGGGTLYYSGAREHINPFTELDFLKQIERLAAGEMKTPVIYGGRLQLIDRDGRYWVVGRRTPDVLRAYDSKAKQWIEHRLPSGEPLAEDKRNAARTATGAWLKQAVEDTSGNVHFVVEQSVPNEPRSTFIATRLANGNWLRLKLVNTKGEKIAIYEDSYFVAQPGGRVCLSVRGDAHVVPTPYFDGKAWTIIQVPSCKDPRHKVEQAAPLPDGSILTVCDGSAAWIYWPQGAPASPMTQVSQLIIDLDNPDSTARQQAEAKLLAAGSQIREALETADKQHVSAEARLRISNILDQVIRADGAVHPTDMIQLGRFQGTNVFFVANDRRKSVVLSATDVVDVQAENKNPTQRALIELDANGKWQIRPLPMREWAARGFGGSTLARAKLDPVGNLRLENGLMIDRQTRLIEAAPIGLNTGPMTAAGANGMMAFRQNVVYDPAAANPATSAEQIVYSNGLYVTRTAHVGWGIDNRQFPHSLLRLNGAGEPQRVPNGPPNAGLIDVLPLTRGAFAHPSVRTEIADGYSFGWLTDGAQWKSSPKWFNLIESDPQFLAALTDGSFEQISQEGRVASDGKSRVWMLHTEINDPGALSPTSTTLRYHDGAKLHNVAAEAGIDLGMFAILCTVDDATALLGHDRKANAIVRIRFDNGAWKRDVLQQLNQPANELSFSVAYGASRVALQNSNNPILIYKAGAVQQSQESAALKFVDDKSRIWAADPEMVVAIGDSSTARLEWTGSQIARIVQTKDGAILALDSAGVSRLVVDEGTGKIRVAARFEWETPKTSFRDCFVDESNLIWFGGPLDHVARITLPASFWK